MTTELIASHGTVQGSKENLVKDLKSVVGDADDLLKAAVNSTAEEFTTARTKIEAKLGAAKSRLNDARSAVAKKAGSAANATNEYVRENPWKVVVGAAAVGLITAFLIRRR
ncbi:MAG: DUF883 family protein [Gammaproteobacteria bacterium]|nr:DUF883 domain-containing protein [Rhodocyclaceae bacterium]MBU3907697.1 DUF883 family protein [Gammaproteobacteria bacterium]MBU3990072.1 DUF883 family protein [Gammaproteobacteria bacterium]MBU4004343.1 DUF883 family protein [Gammaproteobacteria bacterium]MBU4019752.1 DUF883 family protein [Gammaproteobacteria bacterium]